MRPCRFPWLLALAALVACCLVSPAGAQLNRVVAASLRFANGTVFTDSALGVVSMTSSGATNAIRVPNGSNAEYGSVEWVSNAFSIGTTPNGGSNRNVRIRANTTGSIIFQASGVDNWVINSSGHLVANTTNTWDIGAAGATSPRTVYAATSVITALFRSDTAKVLVQGTGTGATQLSATQTTAPTCTSNCGTSPSIVGTDTFMTLTMGSMGSPASGFVITFNGTWATAPACTGAPALTGMAIGKLPLTIVTTTTTITVVTNGVAPSTSDKYHFICGGLS